MLDFIYTLFIAPLEFGMDKALSWGYELTGNWGWAIIVMSLIVNTVILPIYLKAEHWQEEERNIRKSFENDEAMIKRTFKGQERFAMITTMHRLAGYSPLLTLRSSVGFFLQIPFFFAAYHLLNHFEPLQGIAFLGLHDLAKPDELFKIGDFTVNFMPILMTVINITSALIYTSNLSKRDKYQLYGMAVIFLVLLYDAASGLVLYWTFNNIYSLLKNAVLTCCTSIPIKNHVHTQLYQKKVWTWTFPLAIVAPCLFLWSNNLTYYSVDSLAFSVCIVISIAAILKLFLEKLPNSLINTQFRHVVFASIYGIAVGLCLCVLCSSIIRALFFNIRWYFTFILPAIFVVIFLLRGYKFANYLLVAQICLALGTTLYNLGYEYKISKNSSQQALSDQSITFQKRPNIYFFLCESYQNLSDVEKIFGYDSSSFIQSLQKLNFLVKDDVYSNSAFTLGSVINLFTLDLRVGAFGNLDVSTLERKIIGGNPQNLLFRIFKENGYTTNFFTGGDPYFFFEQGELLDNTDVKLNKQLSLIQPFLDLNTHIRKRIEPFFISEQLQEKASHLQVINEFLSKNVKNNKPQLLVYYLDIAQHTPSDNTYNYTMKENWVKSEIFQQRIKSGNEQILQIADLIKRKDPMSIVIFMGDHGPTRIRNFPFDYEKLANNVKLLTHVNESAQSFVDDHFHVFFAISMPRSNSIELAKVSHATLFRQIITNLSGIKFPTPKYNQNISTYDVGNSTYVFAIEGQANSNNLFWGTLDRNKTIQNHINNP